MSPLLVVVGATGSQGGSVVRTFLSQGPEWRIRGLTRDLESNSAQALARQGVEMVQADLDEPSTTQTAFAGAQAIFAVTDFWGPFMRLAMDPARQQAELEPNQTINDWAYQHELTQAKSIMEAAAATNGLERFIWSGLSAARDISQGKYTWVYHFDGKADATAHLKRTHPGLWKKTSVIQPGLYATNHSTLPFLLPQKVSDGIYEIAANVDETRKAPYLVAETDTGPFVHALVKAPSAGKNLLAYREMMSIGGFLKLWAQINGVQARVRRTTFEHEAAINREAAEMFEYFNEYGYDGGDATVEHPQDVSIAPNSFRSDVPVMSVLTASIQKNHFTDPEISSQLNVNVSLPSMEDWIKEQDWSNILQRQESS